MIPWSSIRIWRKLSMLSSWNCSKIPWSGNCLDHFTYKCSLRKKRKTKLQERKSIMLSTLKNWLYQNSRIRFHSGDNKTQIYKYSSCCKKHLILFRVCIHLRQEYSKTSWFATWHWDTFLSLYSLSSSRWYKSLSKG